MRNVFRKWFCLTLALMLAIGLVPGWSSPVQAAAPNYFFPDNQQLAGKANPTTINRENSFIADTNRLTIAGTYQYVNSDSLTVRVDQMVSDGSGWKEDPQRYFTAAVNTLSNNRFEIRNLELFSGFNKMTITGKQGNIERSDTFYIVYDDAPYLQSLQVRADSSSMVDLNEGASLILEKPASAGAGYIMQVYIDGKANNTTSVTVDGKKASVLEDGSFYVPALNLNPGKNVLEFELENQSNKVKVYRTIYYYDPEQPYYTLDIVQGTNAQSMLGPKPILTDAANTVHLEAGMIVPYSQASFNDAEVRVYDPDGTTESLGIQGSFNVQDIPSADGTSMKYRLVEFKTNNYTLPKEGDQRVAIEVNHSSVDSTVARTISYLPNELLIQSIELLSDSNPANVLGPLHNSEVQSGTFHIKVTADKNYTSAKALQASLVPMGNVNIRHISGSDKIHVYEISNFPNGQQQIRFQFEGTTNSFSATVNYVSKNFIYVENYFDGQTITLDSRQANRSIAGPIVKLVGFDGAINLEYFINGAPAVDPQPGNVKEYNAPPLNVTTEPGNLNYGENRITFRVLYTEGEYRREVTKEIRLYIVDTNVSTIERFEPVIIPNGGRAPLNDDTELNRIFIDSPDIIYSNNQFRTSNKKVDLIFKAGGANHVKLIHAGETIIEFNTTTNLTDPYNPSIPKTSTVSLIGTTNYEYDYYGNPANFILRIKDFEINDPGTYPFTLELKNNVGATSTQRIELVREVADFRIVAPQPTVGDRIVVNKNFVRFDIEAEGATEVLINGEKAEKRADYSDRFILDYTGLKPSRNNSIKVVINRPAGNLNATVDVYYAYSNQIGSQHMEQLSRKHSVFDKKLELTFPRGTILRKANPSLNNNVEQFYDNTKLLFGIASPNDGVVERMNDYGNIIGYDKDEGSDGSSGDHRVIPIEPRLSRLFTSLMNRDHFTPISSIYWISGGVGEAGKRGEANYKPATNGLNPYSLEGTFTLFEPSRKLVPTNRGELTLTFDESVVEDAGTIVTVFMFTDQGQWVNIGGVVDTRKNTVTVPFDDFGYYMVAKLRYGFNDITNHPWARNVLEALFSKGIMPNLRTEDFGVDDYISRGEFATLLVKSLNLPLNYEGVPTFVDVTQGDRAITWNYEYLETAARAGIIHGLANRYFGPTERLTREQAATMIARAVELKLPINDEKLDASLAKSFTDSAAISYYAKPPVDAVNKAGIMIGKDNPMLEGEKKATSRFDPRSNLTRAEAAQIAIRLLQKSTKMFPKNLN